MESYYSSDEEIAWGPVTIREIKGDFKRAANRKPNRRHTVICNIENCNMDEEALSNDANQLNISGCSTAYFTPNESLKTNTNSDFLEKVSSLINESNSDLSKYASVIEDCSAHSINKSEEHCSKESPIVPVIHITEASPEDNSCQKFINDFKNRNTYYDIEKFQQTLVENTCILSEDEVTTEDNDRENEHHEIDNVREDENYFQTQENVVTEEEIEEVIVISDDSNTSINSSYNSEDLKYENITSFKEQIACVENNFVKEELSESVEDSFENDIQDTKSSFNFMAGKFVEYDCSESDKVEKKIANYFITDKFVEYNCTEKDGEQSTGNKFKNVMENQKRIDYFYTGSDDIDEENNEKSFLNTPNRHLSTIKESLSTSPVIVPNIDFKQFDDSSSKDDSLQLNDTLEEMNRFLCQGLNYSMPDDEIIDNTPAKEAASSQEKITPVNQVVPINKQLFCHKKEKASHIPRGKFTHSEKKMTNKATGSHMSPKSDFKVPGALFRTKLAPPTTPKHNTNLKNIVSPVALYIKNSPRVPLVKNMHPREHPKNVSSLTPTPITKAKQSNKENFPEFCEVVYKPSKKQIESTERHIVVPSYMRNLKIKESQITKHEGRINHKLEGGSKVSEKLLESDITNITVDQSLLDNTGNISVLTTKQAFIK